MALLNKDQIIGASDLPFEDVQVPEWGGDVRITTMSGIERSAYDASLFPSGKYDPRHFRAKLVAHTAVDESGSRIISDDSIPALDAKAGKILDRLWEVSARLNGIGPWAEDAIRKNSKASR